MDDRPEELVCQLLAAKIREYVSGQMGSYAALDRRIGKGKQGWARQFIQGKESKTYPGTPSLGTVLAVLKELRLNAGEFFSEALGERRAGLADEEILRSFQAAAQRRLDGLEARVARLQELESRVEELETERRGRG